MIDRINKPPHGKTSNLAIEEPVNVVLDNELPVYLINSGDEEVTRIDISIQAGSALQVKKLVASSAGKLLTEGTRSLTSAVISEKLDFYGAYLDVNVSTDNAVITLYSLTKHLEELLPLLGELITLPVFPEHELSIHLDRKKQEFLVNNEKVRYVAMNEFTGLVFGVDSAYGQQLTVEDFKNVSRHDIVEFYRKYYSPGRAYIVVSGKIDGNVAGLLNKHLGEKWLKSSPVSDIITYILPGSEKKKTVSKPDSIQSAIRTGRLIMNKLHPDHNRFILLNTILGGYFGSRLMSNLREDKGLTYGISSYIVNHVHGSYFSVATEVNANQTRQALDEIRLEMKKLRNEPVEQKELELVKNYIYGTFLRNFDGPFSLADRFKAVRDFGLGFDHYMKSLDEIMQISSVELLETAQTYLNPDEMITLVVGKIE